MFNTRSNLLVVEVPPWLSPLWLVKEKNYTMWHFGLSRSSGKKKLTANLRDSECDGYCIFLWTSFVLKESCFPLDLVGAFSK